MFLYFKEGDSAENKGQTLRVLEENSAPYLEAKLDNGEPKYKTVLFSDWWDDLSDETKEAWFHALKTLSTEDIIRIFSLFPKLKEECRLISLVRLFKFYPLAWC